MEETLDGMVCCEIVRDGPGCKFGRGQRLKPITDLKLSKSCVAETAPSFSGRWNGCRDSSAVVKLGRMRRGRVRANGVGIDSASLQYLRHITHSTPPKQIPGGTSNTQPMTACVEPESGDPAIGVITHGGLSVASALLAWCHEEAGSLETAKANVLSVKME